MFVSKKVGILAMQGAFDAHYKTVAACSASPFYIKKPEDLEQAQAIILPGGESTTQFDMLKKANLNEALIDFAKKDFPIFATCAGVILLARLNLLAVSIERNAYGSQKYSFETLLQIPKLGDTPFEGIFIRAPKLSKLNKDLEILSDFKNDPVLIKSKNILAATFHPELTNDLRLHKYFLELL